MTCENKQIIDMDNNEIKDNILSLNINQLKSIKRASYLNLFNTVTVLKRTLEYKKQNENINLNGELNLLSQYINKIINLTIDLIVEGSDTINKLKLEETMEIRKELNQLFSIVDGYYIELSYVGELLHQHRIKILAEIDYENAKYDKDRVENLIEIINHFLDEARDNYKKYIYIISHIIQTLPMRLVKENYFNIVKNTIVRNFGSYTKLQVEKIINDYKKQFNSSIRDGYGTKFDYYFTEIQKLRKEKLSEKGLDELDNMVNGVLSLSREIRELSDLILALGLVSNMIIVINLIDGIEIDTDIEEIYKEWIKILDNEGGNMIERFIEDNEEKIKETEQELLKDLEEFEALNTEALNREDFNYDELSENLLYTRKILTYYNDTDLSDYDNISLADKEIVTYDYLHQISDSLIQYINRSIDKMGNLERKVRMRKLLSQIELPFSGIEEFTNYIRYSLDSRVLSEQEINLIIDYILYFIYGLRKSS